MEFRFRAGELRLRLSHLPIPHADAALVEGYFRKQSLPVGFVGEAGDVTRATAMPPTSLMDPFQRAMEKEWIREEMHLRMTVERKILKEEVKIDLELESLMSTKRIQAGNVMVAVALEREHGEERFPESGSDKVRILDAQPMVKKNASSSVPGKSFIAAGSPILPLLMWWLVFSAHRSFYLVGSLCFRL